MQKDPGANATEEKENVPTGNPVEQGEQPATSQEPPAEEAKEEAEAEAETAQV